MGAMSAVSGPPSGIAVIGSSVGRPVTQVHTSDLHEQKKVHSFSASLAFLDKACDLSLRKSEHYSLKSDSSESKRLLHHSIEKPKNSVNLSITV